MFNQFNQSSSLNKDFFIFLKSAIESINPAKLIRSRVRVDKQQNESQSSYLRVLSVDNLGINQHVLNELKLNKNVYVAAFGKAALSMSLEINNLIGDSHLVKGIAILPFNDAEKFTDVNNFKTTNNLLAEIFPLSNNNSTKWNFYFGGENNLPDKYSMAATRKIFEMCSSLQKDDILLTLISGGGSALLTLPISDQITFDLKLKTIKEVVKAGASINELNTVRSCLSAVKGGKLANSARKASIVSLIISDVIDDPLEIIASGPTCISLLNSTQVQAANSLSIIEKFNLNEKLPKEVLNYLRSSLTSLNEDNFSIENINVFNYLIGNNKLATEAILNNATSLNYDYIKILTNSICGEAKVIGAIYACLTFALIRNLKILESSDINDRKYLTDTFILFVKRLLISKSFQNLDLKLSNDSYILVEKLLNELLTNELILLFSKKIGEKKVCQISGGETVVTFDMEINSEHKGGRNQELTLAFEITMQSLLENELQFNQNFEILFSSFGSDGIDGPTDAAGAYFSLNSSTLANQVSFSLEDKLTYLRNHNSYNYFLKNNRLIKTGPSGTNVSDLQVLLINLFA